MEWIRSANLKKYDVISAMNKFDSIYWSKSDFRINKGDVVYIYVGKPVSKIMYKMECINESVWSSDDEGKKDMEFWVGDNQPKSTYECIHLRLLSKYDGEEVSLSTINEKGLFIGRFQGAVKSENNLELFSYLDNFFGEVRKIEEPRVFQKMDIDALRQLAIEHEKNVPKEQLVEVVQYERNPYVSEYAKKRADGICDLCCMPAPFKDKDENPYLECHHVEWLSKGGTDTLDNVVALCANCHRKMHILNDSKDIEMLRKQLKYYKAKGL